VTVEEAMLRHLRPTKVNLASLGNAVPHLHWHLIARFDWDSHFPGAVWAQPQREAEPGKLRALAEQLPDFEEELRKLLPTGG
jgi:diadenosine tetraphosphate (Ap4A) HIT family hydrolase